MTDKELSVINDAINTGITILTRVDDEDIKDMAARICDQLAALIDVEDDLL